MYVASYEAGKNGKYRGVRRQESGDGADCITEKLWMQCIKCKMANDYGEILCKL